MGSIQLKTEVPGPKSRALMKRSALVQPAPLVPYGQVFAKGGSGAVLEDVDGNRFIDLIGGVGCLITGHNHPGVQAAVVEQASRFLHTDFSLVPYESYVELAERISVLCGGDRKVGFFNSGAEAVENAVKVAKRATGRQGIVCFEGAFHGRTMMAMTLTHREVPYKDGFGPFAAEVYRAPYAGFEGASLEDSLGAVETLLSESQIAGVIVEPVLGEGGFVVPPQGFLPGLFDLCERTGTLLIADEVQSGYGRTGNFLAADASGVRPHLVTLGKSIASGLPLSALVADAEPIDRLPSNSLGGTYVGNPVACAAGIAVLEAIEREGLMERAVAVGRALTTGWEKLAARLESVVEVRGMGSMVGVELSESGSAQLVAGAAVGRGLLCMAAGSQGKVIRHLMPLVITDDQIEEAFGVFEEVLEDLGFR